jgi:prepilin-type N-terminal cleavage/methylation domain-containing protein
MYASPGGGRRSERGFTLIELLIVIIILGILAAIIVLAVGGVTDRGTRSACKTDLRNVVVAEEAYFAKNGSYTPLANLVTQKFLREAPETTHYVISVDTSTGEVTADHSNCNSL